MVRSTLREEKGKKGQEETGNKRDSERCKVSLIVTLACFYNSYLSDIDSAAL